MMCKSGFQNKIFSKGDDSNNFVTMYTYEFMRSRKEEFYMKTSFGFIDPFQKDSGNINNSSGSRTTPQMNIHTNQFIHPMNSIVKICNTTHILRLRKFDSNYIFCLLFCLNFFQENIRMRVSFSFFIFFS